MLQNRYGDREFPVRNRWSNARVYRTALRQRHPTRAALRGLIWIGPAAIVLLGWGSDLLPWSGGVMSPGEDRLFLLSLGVFVVLATLGLVIGTLIDARVPRREQERYRRLTGTADLTERQQQLVALDAQSDYSFGGWNSSLDYAPAWSMLPADVRAKHEHDPKRPLFFTMPVLEVARLRAELDAQHHVASGADVELFVADALRDASLSARFHRVLHGADGERMLARVASLTGVSQWDLRALDEPVDGRPPRLLWAADTQRAVMVVRIAYLAGHLDAATAWRLLERAAEPGTGLYGSWDEYWAGVRIGTAFWTDRLESVQRFDEALDGLRRSAWPAARVPFPAGPVPDWLPDFRVGDPSATGDQR